MNKTDEALSKILTTLADKFGTTVDHLYAVLLKQAFLDGIKNAVVILLFATMFVIAAVKTLKYYKAFKLIPHKSEWSEPDYFDENGWTVVLTGILAAIFVIILILCGSVLVDCFFNPEYYALHQIIK